MSMWAVHDTTDVYLCRALTRASWDFMGGDITLSLSRPDIGALIIRMGLGGNIILQS